MAQYQVSIGGNQLFYDDKDDVWRSRDKNAAADSAGSPLVQGTGETATHGPTFWAGEDTSCDAACESNGLSCAGAILGNRDVDCGATGSRRFCDCR